MKAKLNSKNLEYLVSRFSNDSIGFFYDVLNFERLDDWQIQFLKSTQADGKGGKKVARASCHSSGKTLIGSGISIHRICCLPESRTLITSATESQLKSAFGGTISTVINRSIISEWFDVLAESVTLKQVDGSWIKLQPWNVNKPESFAGIHCMSPALIADEASAIDPKIFDSWAGNMMHPNSLELLLGNPLHRRGRLFDAFNKSKDYYDHAHISAYDSSFISSNWINEMKDIYGEESDVFRVRVLGQFPETDSDVFINEKILMSSVNRYVEIDKNEPIVGGLDVGQFRDASVLVIRQGKKILEIIKWKTRDTMILAQEVYHAIQTWNIQVVCIDGNGVGSGVADRLNQLCPDKVYRFTFANLGLDSDKKYSNTRARAWGRAKEWLETGSIPNNQDLINEGSSLLYFYDKYGRYVLESKEMARDRGVGSPDNFDAFAYSVMASIDYSAQTYKSWSQQVYNASTWSN